MSIRQAADFLGCDRRTVWRRISEGWLTRLVERLHYAKNVNYVPRPEVEMLAAGRIDSLKEFHRTSYPDVARPYLLTNGKKAK